MLKTTRESRQVNEDARAVRAVRPKAACPQARVFVAVVLLRILRGVLFHFQATYNGTKLNATFLLSQVEGWDSHFQISSCFVLWACSFARSLICYLAWYLPPIQRYNETALNRISCGERQKWALVQWHRRLLHRRFETAWDGLRPNSVLSKRSSWTQCCTAASFSSATWKFREEQ